jgi:hypothetical protein
MSLSRGKDNTKRAAKRRKSRDDDAFMRVFFLTTTTTTSFFFFFFVLKILVCRELLTSRYFYICVYIACVPACVFLSLSLSLSIVYLFLLSRCSLPRNLVADPRQI